MHFSPSSPQVLMHRFLCRHPDAMLNVGMGLSKTAACLMTLDKMFKEGQSKGCLIIGPRRVVSTVWPEEVSKWDQFAWMKVVNLREPSGRRAFLRGAAHIYVISYDSIHVLAKLCRGLHLCGYRKPFDTVIFDEITRAKSPSSKRIKMFRKYVGRVSRQWGLTGTMQPNNLVDLFAQYLLLDGGQRLGDMITHFRHRFFKRDEYCLYTWHMKEGSRERVAALVADMTLTLTSRDYLDIPPPFYEDVELEMPTALKKQYRKLERELVFKLTEDTGISVPSMGALVGKLLQFSSGFIYDENKVAHPIHDLKLEAFKEAMEGTDGPLLVAVGFRHELAVLRKYLPKAKFFEDYKTPSEERQLLRDWNAGKIDYLVAHPASAGHGLNMQHGSHEILWWTQTYNRDWFDQMNARLARTGQKKNVRIRRLMVKGTIDEAVACALEEKRDSEDALFACLKMLETDNPIKLL